MKQDNAKKITYGAMMLALFLVLLAMTIYVPFIGLFTLWLLPLPFLLYRNRYDRMATIVVAVGAVALSVIITGILSLPFTIVFVAVGVVMGESIVNGKSKLYTFMATAVTIIILTIIFYVSAIFLFGMNMVELLRQEIDVMRDQTIEFLTMFNVNDPKLTESIEANFTFYDVAIPSLFILSTFILAYILILPNFAIAGRLEKNIPKFPSFRNIKLPLITLLVYGVVLLIPLFSKMDPNTGFYVMIVNASIILRFLFFIQGLSLIYFSMHAMKLPTIVPIIATVFALIFSPITVLLGIVDVGINIRALIGEKRR